MLIDAQNLKEQVIEPTLRYLNDFNASAVTLLLGTAAVESDLTPLGMSNVKNETSGIGLYNISPQAHTEIWDKYLAFDPNLASQIRGLASQRSFLTNPHTELSTNLSYATAVAWCIYRRSNISLKSNEKIQTLAMYWGKYFHEKVSSTITADFCENYNQLVIGKKLSTDNIFDNGAASAA